MQLEIIIRSKVKSERERQILCDTSYIWNLKYDTNELLYKTETDSQTQRAGRKVGDGWSGSLGLANANYCIQHG